MTEFKGFPKMARLSREMVVTEKLDGTNASIYISEDGEFLVGSRTRWITPEEDNYGFAKWAYKNKEELMKLGHGHHFGEWWGKGIQRGYNEIEKKFSLFNTIRWCLHDQEPQIITQPNASIVKYQEKLPSCVSLVPVLYTGLFSTDAVNDCISFLKGNGSVASKGFMKPEGVVAFHIAANFGFKKTIEKDDIPKSLVK